MKYYYKNKVNRHALPYMFQIMRIGYRHKYSDGTLGGFDNARALITIGYSRKSKKFHFMFKNLFKKNIHKEIDRDEL